MKYKRFVIVTFALILGACSNTGTNAPTLTPIEEQGQRRYLHVRPDALSRHCRPDFVPIPHN